MGTRRALPILLVLAGCVDDPILSRDLAPAIDGSAFDLATTDSIPELDFSTTTPEDLGDDLLPAPLVFARSDELQGASIVDVAAFDDHVMYALAAGYLWRWDEGVWSRRAAFPNGTRVAVSHAGANLVAVASEVTGATMVEQSEDGGLIFSAMGSLGANVRQLEYVQTSIYGQLWALEGNTLKNWNVSLLDWVEVRPGVTVHHVEPTPSIAVAVMLATSTGLQQLSGVSWQSIANTTSATWVSAQVVDVDNGTLIYDHVGTTSGITSAAHIAWDGSMFRSCETASLPGSVTLFAAEHVANLGGSSLVRRVSYGCTAPEPWSPLRSEGYGATFGAMRKAAIQGDLGVVPATFGVVRFVAGSVGASIETTDLYGVEVRRMSHDMATDAVLLATNVGVFRSLNKGLSWSSVDAAQHAPATFVGQHGGHLLIGVEGRRFLSADDGVQFADAGEEYAGPTYAIDPFLADRYYACQRNAGATNLLVSDDAGETFHTALTTGGAPTSTACAYVATSQREAGVLWIVGHNGELRRSVTRGDSWIDVGFAVPAAPIKQLLVDPTDGARLYVLQDRLRRIDSTVTLISEPTTGPIRSFAIDPVNGMRIYVATRDGLFRSLDGGVIWSKLRNEPGTFVYVNPVHPTNVYYGTSADGFFVSQ